MTDTEILKKAIGKAVKNGFDVGIIYNFDETASIIFSHDFAEAFFKGQEVYTCGCEEGSGSCDGDCPEDWLLHIQRMVKKPEPLKYLEKFL